MHGSLDYDALLKVKVLIWIYKTSRFEPQFVQQSRGLDFGSDIQRVGRHYPNPLAARPIKIQSEG